MSLESLITELRHDGYLKSPRLIEAFLKIDRKDFVPKELWAEAYGNYPLPIGEGQTISQPLTVAFMLELLEPRPGEKILEVGAGSGWQAALLAYAVSGVKGQVSSGRVVAVERIPELAKMAERNISKYNFMENGIVHPHTKRGAALRANRTKTPRSGVGVKIILGDGSNHSTLLMAGGGEKFDKIIAAAAINPRESVSDLRRSALMDAIPQGWKEQLRVGGRIVAPVGQSIVVLDKIRELEFSAEGGPASGWKEKEYSGFSFVPLVSGESRN